MLWNVLAGYFPIKLECLPEGTCIHPHVPVYQVWPAALNAHQVAADMSDRRSYLKSSNLDYRPCRSRQRASMPLYARSWKRF